MDCQRTNQQLSPYVDGRLPVAAAERLERHLAGCEQCAAELAELRALKALLAGAPRPQAPPGFWDAVHQELREEVRRRERQPARPWTLRLWGRAPAMAAGLAVMLLAACLPLWYLEPGSTSGGVTINELVARHAGYCAQQPLLEHGRFHYLVAEVGDAEAQ